MLSVSNVALQVMHHSLQCSLPKHGRGSEKLSGAVCVMCKLVKQDSVEEGKHTRHDVAKALPYVARSIMTSLVRASEFTSRRSVGVGSFGAWAGHACPTQRSLPHQASHPRDPGRLLPCPQLSGKVGSLQHTTVLNICCCAFHSSTGNPTF